MAFMNYFKKFDDKLKDDSLENYWNIPQSKFSKTTIRYEKIDTPEINIILTIRFSKKYNISIYELPTDISRYICEFLYEDIEIKTRINYTSQFPFDRPEWFFVSVSPSYIPESAVKTIIDDHNCNNTSSWSPIIQIDRDFLTFFVKILKIKMLSNTIIRPDPS
jgi:hypothetical protein